MKTGLNKRLIHFSRLVLMALVALTLLAGSLPQIAHAASAPCVTYYTFKKGDTSASVAHTFGLAWWEIGVANNMKYPYKPAVGQRLCIPPAGWAETQKTAASGNLSASSKGSKVFVVASAFTERHLWVVKVKDTTGAVSGDFKVGRMVIPKTTTVKGTFNLPSELRNSTYLTVCLKNQTTDEKICKNIIHVP